MNRLRDIRQTLLPNLEAVEAYGNAEIVLVDYSSNDGLVEWVREHCPEYLRSAVLKFYRVEGKQYFHVAHAKNIAHKRADGEVVCNVDADNFISKEYTEFIAKSYRFDPDVFGMAWKWAPDAPALYVDLPKGLGGRLFLSRLHFQELGGYDARFFGYGLEDKDLIVRAESKGLRTIFTPREYLQTFHTTDEDRMANLPEVDSSATPKEAVDIYHRRNRRLQRENQKSARVAVNESGWGEDLVEQIL